tara:strand:- start:266 stop:496 length:231 start_codon:yes stop_codon:yes gene_type:complete
MIDTTQLNNEEQEFLVYLLNTSNRPVPIVTRETLPFQNRTFVENLLNYVVDTNDDEGLITDDGIKLIQGILSKWTE